MLAYFTLRENAYLLSLAVQCRASPHDVRVATKDAFPFFIAINFQTIVPQPIPGSWQFAGADGPGMIAVIVGAPMGLRLMVDFWIQKVECKVTSTVEPDLTEKVLLFPGSDILTIEAALDWVMLESNMPAQRQAVPSLRLVLYIYYLVAQVPAHVCVVLVDAAIAGLNLKFCWIK